MSQGEQILRDEVKLLERAERAEQQRDRLRATLEQILMAARALLNEIPAAEGEEQR